MAGGKRLDTELIEKYFLPYRLTGRAVRDENFIEEKNDGFKLPFLEYNAKLLVRGMGRFRISRHK